MPQKDVDDAWATIATATVNGQLGSSAKVAPFDPAKKGYKAFEF